MTSRSLARRLERALVAGVLAGTWVGGGDAAAQTEPPPQFRVTYEAPVVAIEAESAPLVAVLRELGERAGFAVTDRSGAVEPMTVGVSGTIETVLRRLLAGSSHALVYDERGWLREVVLLGPGGVTSTPPVPTSTTAEPVPPFGPAAATPGPELFPPERLAELALHLESDTGDAAVEASVEHLLRAQALQVLWAAAPGGKPPRLLEPPPAPEPAAGDAASLALRAQEGVRALVDALLTAEAALRAQMPEADAARKEPLSD